MVKPADEAYCFVCQIQNANPAATAETTMRCMTILLDAMWWKLTDTGNQCLAYGYRETNDLTTYFRISER